MSEFSASFHLRLADEKKAVQLLLRAEVAGYVFPTAGAWTAFVAEEDGRDAVIEANQGELLVYDYAEDHGCVAELYRGEERVARLKVSFEGGKRLVEGALFVAAGVLSAEAAASLEAWAEDKKLWRSDEYRVAEALGLTEYKWLSFHYASDEKGRDPPDGRIDVRPARYGKPAFVHRHPTEAQRVAAKRAEDAEGLAALAEMDAELKARDSAPKKPDE